MRWSPWERAKPLALQGCISLWSRFWGLLRGPLLGTQASCDTLSGCHFASLSPPSSPVERPSGSTRYLGVSWVIWLSPPHVPILMTVPGARGHLAPSQRACCFLQGRGVYFRSALLSSSLASPSPRPPLLPSCTPFSERGTTPLLD